MRFSTDKSGKLLIIILLFLLFAPNVAHAQPPTPTPGPAYVEVYNTDEGDEWIIERSYTYGDMATFVALCVLIAIEIIAFTFRLHKEK